jgi:hypothetical protein
MIAMRMRQENIFTTQGIHINFHSKRIARNKRIQQDPGTANGQ